MRVMVSGSRGLIGDALVKKLEEQGHEVWRLVRSGAAAENEVTWDPADGAVPVDALEEFDAVVHLGGRSIGEKRWTINEKERVWTSRVASTEALAKALTETIVRPRVFVCASAVGYYGDRGDEKLTERSAKGEGYLAELCATWEGATAPAADLGIRVVNLRSGVVLSPTGGALARQLTMFRLCLGGRLGTGKQYLSWITLDDEVNAIIHAIKTPKISGPINLVSPNPVRNEDFTAVLGIALHRPTLIPITPWMLKVALGAELSNQVLLAGQRALPTRLLASGFRFQDAEIDDALLGMLRTAPSEAEAPEEPKPKTGRGRRNRQNGTGK